MIVSICFNIRSIYYVISILYDTWYSSISLNYDVTWTAVKLNINYIFLNYDVRWIVVKLWCTKKKNSETRNRVVIFNDWVSN